MQRFVATRWPSYYLMYALNITYSGVNILIKLCIEWLYNNKMWLQVVPTSTHSTKITTHQRLLAVLRQEGTRAPPHLSWASQIRSKNFAELWHGYLLQICKGYAFTQNQVTPLFIMYKVELIERMNITCSLHTGKHQLVDKATNTWRDCAYYKITVGEVHDVAENAFHTFPTCPRNHRDGVRRLDKLILWIQAGCVDKHVVVICCYICNVN